MDPQQLVARFKTLTASFSAGQLVSLIGSFVMVVTIVAGSAWWLNAPSYALLFSDMDAESAGQIVTRLKTLKVQYQLDEGGRAVRVPANRVDELRLELTAQGLPSSGRVGFEIFDRTAFGATQFLEQINYRRALEGEIARTIATISEVANARVHIAMGKESLFGEPRPAKASVVLKLRGQRGLSESAVAGISNLVAASVEGLRADAVVILDSFGRPLIQPRADGGDAMAAQNVERQQRLEREMAARVVTLLEPVVGPDRVRVNIAVKLNPKTQEETEERWDPNTVVRTRQMTADQASSAMLGGIAGARGNEPPPAPDPAAQPAAAQTVAATGPGSSRNAETTTYEVSRTTRHTLQPPGEVARLSVAVILDDDHVATEKDGQTTVARKPRTPEEIQKIHGLVAAAVGLEPDRGDLLTVENVGFDEPVFIEPPPAPFLERYNTQIWEGGRIAVVGVIALMAFFLFLRPMMKRIGLSPAPAMAVVAAGGAQMAMPMAGRGPRTVAEMESEIDAQLDSLTAQYSEDRRLPVLTRRVSAVTVNEPESVAKLLRGWISEQDR